MPKITKRVVDAVEVREKDYVVWDDELPGFGLRVFGSGKRSYVIQYRTAGHSRRYTIGLHGVWTPETAWQEAKAQLGRVPIPHEEHRYMVSPLLSRRACARAQGGRDAQDPRRCYHRGASGTEGDVGTI